MKYLIGVDYRVLILSGPSLSVSNLNSRLKELSNLNIRERGQKIDNRDLENLSPGQYCTDDGYSYYALEKEPVTVVYRAGKTSHIPKTNQILINGVKEITTCVDKLKTFKALDGYCNIPPYSTDLEEALDWPEENVIGRTLLTSSGGKGLVFREENLEEFLRAKLFTKYIKRKGEYRVHVSQGRAFDLQQKKLKLKDFNGNPIDKSKVDWRVRNTKNGFIFSRINISVPDCVIEEAEKACKITGIDLAAVDVIYGIDEKPYVLEINTRPGLVGTTLENYAKEIQNVCDNLLGA